jgi:parallel beta-helix repeat protein
LKPRAGLLRKTVSGILLALLLISIITFTFNIQPAKAQGGTITINADGSVYPSTAPISTTDKVTYTLTGNIINCSIVVNRSNIIINGEGYTVQGSGSRIIYPNGVGISMTRISNVTVEKTEIKAFYYGIQLDSSLKNSISGNNITNNYNGIWLLSSNYTIISGNNVTANSGGGIGIYGSSNNIISKNNIKNNNDGIFLSFFWVYNNGISLSWPSNNNIISGNNVTANTDCGIELYSSSSNFFYHNDFVNNSQQVGGVDSSDTWDNGSISGGNYWSDYQARYPSAAQIDSSGIWNTPYVIGVNNVDHYPLMSPYGVVTTSTIISSTSTVTSATTTTVAIIGAIVVVIIAVVGFFVYRKFIKKKAAPTPSTPILSPTVTRVFCTNCGREIQSRDFQASLG